MMRNAHVIIIITLIIAGIPQKIIEERRKLFM